MVFISDTKASKALLIIPFFTTIKAHKTCLSVFAARPMEDVKRSRIPAFGNWDFCEELPVTQYFESASQAGLFRGYFYGEDHDLIKVPDPAKPAYHHHQHHPKGKMGGGEKQHGKEGRVCDLTTQPPKMPRPHKAVVDEDLYKISPGLLYQKPKRKNLPRSFWSGCLGLNCIP